MTRRFYFLSLLAAGTITHTASAQPLAEHFDKAISRDAWDFLGKPKTVDGTLVLETEGNSSGFVDAGLIARVGNRDLNFLRQPVDLQFSGIEIAGTASDQNRLFIMIIGADSSKETKAQSFVKLRLSADGKAAIMLGEPDSAGQVLVETNFTPPLKTLTLHLDSRSVALKIDSARGVTTSRSPWPGQFSAAAWSAAEPFIVLKAVRSPGDGDCKVTLTSLVQTAAAK